MQDKNFKMLEIANNSPFIKQHIFLLFISVAKYVLPINIVLVLTYIGLFSGYLTELILQISAILIFLLGLPLSAGFRVDQISLNLGGQYPREIVLLIASLVTWFNLILIFGFRAWLRVPIKKN